jgi:predicted dithiol-disulfide oxidoreductase (DUF899 family)
VHATTELRSAYEAVIEAKAGLLKAIKDQGPQTVEDWELRDLDGSPIRLSELFGEHDDLLVVHNMGKGCSYCTLWADGFRGIADHLGRRCSFVLCSNDEPAIAKAFAEERGWNFRCVSGAGSGFARAMGYADENNSPLPGVSSFHRNADGSITRVSHAPFGPGDDFCAVWPMFDLLQDGANGWTPR